MSTVTIYATSPGHPVLSAAVTLLPVVSVSILPTGISLTNGGSATFSASVTGDSNTAVTWLTPTIGSVSSGGVYTVPMTLVSQQTIKLTAQSVVDPTKLAAATIVLTPTITVTLNPISTQLTGGQSTALNGIVNGTTNTAITWSLSPQIGTLSNGIYTAPSAVVSAQAVTVTATSQASTSQNASVVLSLVPVSIVVTPPSASLSSGQSATFNATVSGTSNSGAIWTATPAVGTVTNGVYTAPALVTVAQVVTVTATSSTDKTKSASAMISLTAPVSIAVTPATASLTSGQSATFNATVSGTSNSGAIWTITPPVGTVTNGVYTAPALVTIAQVVTVTATSSADNTKSASAMISLTAPVSIVVSPSTVLLTSGQTTTLKATVTGSSNTAVNWSMTPPVGTLSNGIYTAPVSIASAQTITVTAASAADPTKIAAAVVTLSPTISVVVLPSSATLSGGQSLQFNVSLSGTTNPAVSWSLSPPVGTVSGGLYQAPATNNIQQTVSVTVASLADPTKTASALVALVPTIAIALTPSTISLTGGQSTQFIVTIGGTPSTAVTWTLAPLVGTITNGMYTAPATINALQTIILTVANIADPAQTATASVTLGVAPSTTVNPSQATLTPSQTQQFTASGLGTTPNWTLSPATGTISTTGLYNAPSTVLTETTVTVIVTNATDATKAASAVLTLRPAASQTPPPPTTITLPIEVMGDAGTTVPVQFSISSSSNLTGQIKLWLQIHGLKYQTEASVQVNSGAWLPINDTTVTLQGLAKSYGGIGGGFSTLKLTMNLPSGAIVAGTNTLNFRFNGTDGITSGFRVLNLNVLAANGSQLISPSSFTLDDPGTWQPPLNSSSDIAAGHTLFTSASLTSPGGAIRANCNDCHTQDGRDLKYFNYSNFSIRSRAMFHGLTAQQGDQIASYIRSLNILVPANARPWNPPYQPGPGTDSSPVSEWAAGAGIDGVLDQDSDMMPALMPGGSMAAWAPSANLSAREIPTAVQFLDWNRWLPTIYPGDAYSTFASNPLFTQYQAIRAGLIPGNAASYKSMAPQIWLLSTYMYQFRLANELAFTDARWNALKGQQIYSIGQWTMVKLWELNQEFRLESMPKVAFGPEADDRGWYSQVPFQVSPNMMHIPLSGNLDNGTNSTRTYLAYIWYHLQLVLNAGNGQFVENSPIDFSYVYSFVGGGLAGTNDVPASVRNGPLMLLWLIKALQDSNHLPGPEKGDHGWSPNNTRVQQLFVYANLGWRDLPQATAGAAMEQMLTLWLAKVKTFTPQQFYAGGYAKSTDIPKPLLPDSSFANWVANMIPPAQYFGVSHTVLTNIAAWAKTMWPNYNWLNLLNANCAPYQGILLNCPVP